MASCHISKLNLHSFTFCLVFLFTMQTALCAVIYLIHVVFTDAMIKSLVNLLFIKLNSLSSFILIIIFFLQFWVIFVILFPVSEWLQDHEWQGLIVMSVHSSVAKLFLQSLNILLFHISLFSA